MAKVLLWASLTEDEAIKVREYINKITKNKDGINTVVLDNSNKLKELFKQNKFKVQGINFINLYTIIRKNCSYLNIDLMVENFKNGKFSLKDNFLIIKNQLTHKMINLDTLEEINFNDNSLIG